MSAPARVLIVQHGDKERNPGDPGLTALGHSQARASASHLATRRPVALYASPQRRALETAEPIARATGLPIRADDRLRERLNWDDAGEQAPEAFLAEWERTVADRAYVPSRGDSSHAAAARFREFLQAVNERHAVGPVVAVTHGGVTVDLLRSLIGDARLRATAPGVFEHGMPCCGLTALAWEAAGWQVLGVGTLVGI